MIALLRRRAARVVTRLAGALALLLAAPRLDAQYLTRPRLPWRTLETAHFVIHYPAAMAEWTESVAQHIDTIASAVNAAVGNTPTRRVTVVVEDPSNMANGFALPFLDGPLIFLWPTPPSPTPSFGTFRSWGEDLSVHEYAHIAHLTIPSRNPRERLFWRLMPVRIGPVARKSPDWVIEGYATYVEGKLTGSGRPNSVGRAAVIREWAIEGKLPIYAQLDASGPFLGGSMRYLLGSAYLEWLAERKGEQSLEHLWRRMSARRTRGFAEAFTGVYGAPPDDLYGRFFADVMGKALAVERTVEAQGIVDGELVQKLTWYTGEPAVSADGSRMAVVLRARGKPSRLVVWQTGPDPRADSVRAAERRRLLEHDPLDVPAIDSFPPPKRALATLSTRDGRGHDFPRFFRDGERILVSREEPVGDGTTRPDLFIWNYRRNTLRRVTRGAAIRYADPSPDGTSAVGVRCLGGICDLVRVDLATGAIARLAAGSPTTTWSRPRFSPDGRRIAAAVQSNGSWRIAIVPAGGGAPRNVGPDDGGDRYAPSFSGDDSLVVVSERGGIPNLELVSIASGATRPLTRVTGAVLAPDASRSDRIVYFLSMHAKGYDVRRIALDSTPRAPLIALDPRQAPAAPPRPELAPPFPASAARTSHAYGLGPRSWRWLPGGAVAADGAFATLLLANTDPIGRLGVVLQGGLGGRETWRGGALAAAYRALPATVEASAFGLEQRPSEGDIRGAVLDALDATYSGASLATTYDRNFASRRYTLRAGGSAGRLNRDAGLADGARTLGFAELRGGVLRARGEQFVSSSIALHAATGSTAGDHWNRALATLSLAAGTGLGSLRAAGTLGMLHRSDVAPASSVARTRGSSFEEFAVGGAAVPYIDQALLSQRIALPAVPVGYASGRKLALVTASAGGFVLTPYITWVSAGEHLARWQRVIGAERDFVMESIAFARLPAVHVRGGVGYSLDAPFRKELRGYLSVAYQP